MALTSSRTMASKTAGMTKEEIQKAFKPSKEVPSIKGIKLGIFGLDGQGKTYQCLTAEGDIYAIDSEGEVSLIKDKFPKELQERLYILDIVQYMKDNDGVINIASTLENVEKKVEDLKNFALSNPDYKATIVIDSDTDLKIKYDNWLEQQTDIARTRAGKPQQREYGRINKPQNEMLDNLKMTGWNIIVTARGRPSYDASGVADPNLMMPHWFSGMGGWLDIWGEIKMIAGKQKYIIRKCRYDITLVGDVIEEPTVPKIIDYIKQKTGIKIE